MVRKVCSVITFLTGNHTKNLRTPLVVNPDYEYLCISDNPKLTNPVWKCIYDETLLNYSNMRDRTAAVKFNPFKYTDCDYAFTIDASCQIASHLTFIPRILDNYEIGVRTHPIRHNIYTEIDTWVNARNMPQQTAKMLRYSASHLHIAPTFNHLFEGSMIMWKNSKISRHIQLLTQSLLKIAGVDGNWCMSNQIPFTIVCTKVLTYAQVYGFANIFGVTKFQHNSSTSSCTPAKNETFLFNQPYWSPDLV